MKFSYARGLSVLAMSSLLVGCQGESTSEEISIAEESSVSSTSKGSSSEAQKQTSESHTHEHHDHEHDHDHAKDEEFQKIYEGYFEDSQVKDRSLSDWQGDWQSVYPYLQDGTLDEVFAYKEKHNGDKTAQQYKEYYNEGYETDVDRIQIEKDTVTFFKKGEELSGQYIYDGYEILTYDAGNRGVRYIFKLAEETEGLPQYIQFSDHSINPTEASHYHLYWGDDREALLKEVTNWPTYYPGEMDGHEIAHEMMSH